MRVTKANVLNSALYTLIFQFLLIQYLMEVNGFKWIISRGVPLILTYSIYYDFFLGGTQFWDKEQIPSFQKVCIRLLCVQCMLPWTQRSLTPSPFLEKKILKTFFSHFHTYTECVLIIYLKCIMKKKGGGKYIMIRNRTIHGWEITTRMYTFNVSLYRMSTTFKSSAKLLIK